MISLGVIPIMGESGRYMVRSSGITDREYLVDLDEDPAGWCGCPHFEYKVGVQLSPVAECKHLRRARLYQRLQRIISRRSS